MGATGNVGTGRAYKWTPPLSSREDQSLRVLSTPKHEPWQRRRSAERIQAAFRQWRMLRFVAANTSFSHAWASSQCIQGWWRTLKRKWELEVTHARIWWRVACELLESDKAARRLQGGFHMLRLQSWRRSAVTAAKRFQACWRGMTVRTALRLLLWAARRLQRWWRQHAARAGLLVRLRRLCSQVHRAATLLQSRWRGIQVRMQYGPELETRRLLRFRRKMALRKAQLAKKSHGFFQSSRHTLPVGGNVATLKHSVSRARMETSRMEHRSSLGFSVSAKQDSRCVSATTNMNARPVDLTKLQRPLQRLGLAQSECGFHMAAQATLPSRNSTAGNLDVSKLLRTLLSRGVISCSPRAPLWPQERPGMSDLDAVRSWLIKALPSVDVRAVYRLECTTAVSVAYNGVRRTLGPERLLWHGTLWDSVANIVQNGFNRAYVGRHGTKLGRGTYFADDAAYALRFSGRSPSRAIFLAGVLPGRCCRGEEGLVEPPLMDATGARFDSTVDDPEQPRIFCVFRDFQALPLYLVEMG